MTPTTPDQGPPVPPAQFISLSTLLGPTGLLTRALNPTPSRRALIRRLRAAGVLRWKCNGAYAPGRGEVYFDHAAVTRWLQGNATSGADKGATAHLVAAVPGSTRQ